MPASESIVFGKILFFLLELTAHQNFFGFAEAVSIRMQGTVNIPNQFILMIPYVLTMVMLAGLIRRADPPKALGVAYAKE